MKTFIRTHVLLIMFFIFIFLPFPVNSQDRSPTLASDIEKVIEVSRAEKNQVDPLLGIAAVASAAIHTADSTVSTMVQIISLIGIIFTLAATALIYLGFKTWGEAKEHIKKQTERLNTEINKQHNIIDAASRSMVFTTNTMHEWEMAASLQSDPDKNQDEIEHCYKSALNNLEHVISSAKVSENITLESWGYGMKAYIHKRLHNLPESINNAEKAILVLENFLSRHEKGGPYEKNFYIITLLDEIKEKLPNRYYNLACYYCLLGDSKEKCLEYLRKAFSGDPEYKNKAPSEEDLEKIWRETEFLELTKNNPPKTNW